MACSSLFRLFILAAIVLIALAPPDFRTTLGQRGAPQVVGLVLACLAVAAGLAHPTRSRVDAEPDDAVLVALAAVYWSAEVLEEDVDRVDGGALGLLSGQRGSMHVRELVELLADDGAEVLQAHPVDALVNRRDQVDVRDRGPVEGHRAARRARGAYEPSARRDRSTQSPSGGTSRRRS